MGGVDPSSFPELAPEHLARWSRFGRWETPFFPQVVGLEVVELRDGWCRMRLPYRPELQQPAGVVHGGAIATLIDTVVVPAIAARYEQVPLMLTLSMTVQYLGASRGEDLVADGWVVRRGRSVVFCEVAVATSGGDPVATGTLVYQVRAAT